MPSILSRTTTRRLNVGFVGIGQMGEPMAKNLLNKGVNINVCDSKNLSEFPEWRDRQRDIKYLAQNSDVIFTMLPSSETVKLVYKAPDGLLMNCKKSSLMIDCSTIEYDVAQDLAKECEKRNLNMIDAPVSGGIIGAQNGTLTFMVGGKEESYEKSLPYLKLIGSNFFYCGPSGMGQVAKVCNNMLLAISMIGLSESLILGKKLGLDPTLLSRIINSSSGRCWSSEIYNPVPGILANSPASRNYEGGFSNQLISKDLCLAMKAGGNANFSPTLGLMAKNIYEHLQQNDSLKSKDFSVVFQELQAKRD